MHLFAVVLLCLGPLVASQFYRGELEPRYSRKTPFRQQTEIPDAVFGIGHGARRFAGDRDADKSSRERPTFFGERREPERRNSGREDGRDYEESGDEFGRPGNPRRGDGDEEEGFGRHGPHDFKRPQLPDPEEVRGRFDKEREQRPKSEGRERERGRPQSAEGQEEEDPEDHRREEHRPRRPRPHQGPRRRYDEDEDEQRERPEEHPEEPRNHHHHRHEEPEEAEHLAETPSKVVGLNMQMVAGVYPKEKKGPVIEDVEKRGGRFVDKPNKFFRGSGEQGSREPKESREHSEEQRRADKSGEHSKDSGEHREEPRQSGESHEAPKQRGDPEEHPEEQRRRKESHEEPRGEKPAQQQAPPPPKPQIPPFPPFPKFPGFGGFQPFQPDFPTRQFGGDGGFAGGPWNASGGPSGREGAPRDDTSSRENRPGEDGRRAHQPDTTAAPPDDSRAGDESAERRDQRAHHGKEDEGAREEEQEEKKIKSSEVSEPKKDFPTPGRFVTNIRAKKSGEILDATLAPPTTSSSTTSLPTTMPSTYSGASGIMLPTEKIVPKLRSIVQNQNQRIKVV